MSNWCLKEITKATAGKDDRCSGPTIATWRQLAAAAATNKQNSKSGSFKFKEQWNEKILSHGSARDKILLKYKLISSNPIAHCKHLDSLISMVTPAKKRDCATAIDVLQKLFKVLLPKSRVLIAFDQRPFNSLNDVSNDVGESSRKKNVNKALKNTAKRDECLSLWLFEDTLKKRYDDFLSNMENIVLRDVLEQNKRKAVAAMFELLQTKPEQRGRLIKILVNKVGDPSGKLASHAKHKLLLTVHKKQTLVPAFVDEFERMLYRPNIAEKAQYFAICCLNSMQLRKKTGKAGDGVPLKLIKIYCSFFRAALNKNKIVKEKLLGALLSGIHRAFPFLTREEVTEHLKDHVNDLFRLVHTAHTFSQSVQALMVLFHFNQYHEEMKDRFYQVLYRKIGDWRLLRRSSQRQSLLLHLIYRCLSEDDDVPRLRAFIKRLLQLCLYSSDTPLICGVLLVVSELQKVHPESISTTQIPVKVGASAAAGGDGSDEEEYFPDIDSDLEDEERAENERKRQAFKALPAPSTPSTSARGQPFGASLLGYDPTARNPRYCGAEKECTWELLQLKNNFYHPSVRVFAASILSSTPIDYSGDPFEDFTRIHFLDRFVQKKPKKIVDENSSATAKARSVAINSEEYRKLEEHQIPVDERCFHEFSKVQHARKMKKKGVVDEDMDEEGEERDEEDVESVADEDFDEFLDKYEKGMDSDLKDLDDIEDNDSEEDVLMDLSDEEVDFNFSDEDEEEDSENEKEIGDESSEPEDDDDDDDNDDENSSDGADAMDVDDDDDDDFLGFDDGSNPDFYSGHHETPKEKKQRQWEEKRMTSGSMGNSNKTKGFKSFRGKGGKRPSGSFRFQGQHRGNKQDKDRGGNRGRFRKQDGGPRRRGGGNFKHKRGKKF